MTAKHLAHVLRHVAHHPHQDVTWLDHHAVAILIALAIALIMTAALSHRG